MLNRTPHVLTISVAVETHTRDREFYEWSCFVISHSIIRCAFFFSVQWQFFVRYQEFPHRPWQWHHTLRANVVIQSVESNRFTAPWTKTNSNAVTTDFVSPIFVSQSSSNKLNQNMYALLFWFFILFSHFVIVQRSVANKFVCQYDSCSASYWFNIYIISIQKDLFFGLVLVAIVSVVVVITNAITFASCEINHMHRGVEFN